MEGRTLTDLFTEVINRPRASADLGLSPGTVKAMRSRLRGNKQDGISRERMAEVLTLAGYQIIQPELWAEPK